MSKYNLNQFLKDSFPVTQAYGNNPDYYKQFGFAGHEGVDYGTPTGTPVYSPFDGVIVRDTDNAKEDAYGIKVVIWDPVQKCAIWLCHLQSNSVNLGDKIKKGQEVGISDNTGNSTGPHLHVNFCETDANGNRININNGYKGFLNILDTNLVHLESSEPTSEVSFQVTDQTLLDTISDGKIEYQAVKSLLEDRKKTLANLQDGYNALNNENLNLHKSLEDNNAEISTLSAQLDMAKGEINTLQKQPSTTTVYTHETFLEFVRRKLKARFS